MNFNININVRRISNGYIITDNDFPKTETFYNALPDLMTALTADEARDCHDDLRRSESDGYEFNLIIKTEDKE